MKTLSPKNPFVAWWDLTYLLFNWPRPDKITVGGFWTRLILTPLWFFLTPLYWLAVGAPIMLPITGLLVKMAKGPTVIVPSLIIGGVSMFGWIYMYVISRKERRRDLNPQIPEIYRMLTWQNRVASRAWRRYMALCRVPLVIRDTR